MSSPASWRSFDRRVVEVPPLQGFPRRRARVHWWRVMALAVVLLICASAWIGVLTSLPHRGPL